MGNGCLRTWAPRGAGRPGRGRGFTLTELMIVIVVIAVLASIAYPSYRDSVRKSRRADAKNALMDAVTRQEQFILDRATYTLNMTDLGYASDPAISEEGWYSFDAAAGACGTIARCFTLTATPRAGQPQASDTQCTSFLVASTGARTATGTLGAECW